MSFELGVENVERTNFRTGSIHCVTDDYFPLGQDQQVVVGEALKLVDGKLKKLEATTDVIYCIANQDADSTGADKKITYDIRGSYFADGLVFAVGSYEDYKEQLDLNGRFFMEVV